MIENKSKQKIFNKVIIIINIIYLIIIAVLLLKIKVSAAVSLNNTAYVYIGDNHIINMYNALEKHDDNIFIVADEKADYDWFAKTGSEELYKLREKNNEVYSSWIYIINLGINDLHNINNYVNLYTELANEAKVYYMLINPTDDSAIKNKDVESFNEELLSVSSNILYIDTYDYLTKVSNYNINKDGSYDNETYTKLYKFSMMSIAVQEFIKDNDNRYSAAFYLFNYR